MRSLTMSLVIIAAAACAAEAEAQTRSAAPPSFMSSSLRAANVSLATYQSVVAYGEQRAQDLVQSEGRRRGAERELTVSNQAIQSMAERLLLSNPRASPAEVLAAFDRMLQDYASLKGELEALRRQRELESLWPQLELVDAALDEGDLEQARVLLDVATGLSERFAEPASGIWRASGDLAAIEQRFNDAAYAYDRAADFLDPARAIERLALRVRADNARTLPRTRALTAQELLAAVSRFEAAETTLLRSSPEEPGYQELWGIVYWSLAGLRDQVAERGDLAMVPRVVSAWQSAKLWEGLTPQQRAQIDVAIGSAWFLSASRSGADQAVAQSKAEQAYQQARSVLAVDDYWYWASHTGSLGVAIVASGHLTGESSIAAFRNVVAYADRVLAEMPSTPLLVPVRHVAENLRVNADIKLAQRGDWSNIGRAQSFSVSELNNLPLDTPPRARIMALLLAADAYSTRRDLSELLEARRYIDAASIVLESMPDADGFIIGYYNGEDGQVSWSIARITGSRSEFLRAERAYLAAADADQRAGSSANVPQINAFVDQIRAEARRAPR
tara:strand:- start:1064 stop:2740 length:1677 start_codon:yes stop_codon:yes gene_type:complete